MNNSVSSNSTGLAFAQETSLKVLPGTLGADAVWYGLEPNTYTDFGATLQTVARTPINNTRQRAKGTTTDLDAKGGFNTDLTQRNMTRLLQGFFFLNALEKAATQPLNGTQVALTDVDADSYNAATGLASFLVGHLAFAKNFAKTNNNGLFHVTAVAAGGLTTDKSLTVEAAPPASAQIEAVGFQFASDDLALTVVGGTVVLTSALVTLTTLGLHVGEWIFVGGDSAGLRYATAADTFFGRIKQITATQIILDITSTTCVNDAGAGKTIQIFFGKVIRNATVASDIVRRTYQLERQLGQDDSGNQAEYLIGACPDEITLDIKQTSKLTADLSFVGMDVEYHTGTDGLKAGTRIDAPSEDAFNTSSDIVYTKLAVLDSAHSNATALFGYLTDAKVSIKNNVSGNKALGVIGSFEPNVGDFEVSGQVTAYFSTVAAAAAIRANADVSLTAILAKKNYGFVVDLPLLSLGNGANKVEKDKAITVDVTHNAAKNAGGYTALMTFFEYLPTKAMPA